MKGFSNQSFVEKIDKSIGIIIDELIDISPEHTKHLIEGLKEFVLRPGKRIRPVLLILSYQGYGGSNIDDAILFGSAIEIMHSFLLVHDDIVDESEIRRGEPTLHKLYEGTYKRQKLGKDLALTVGDIVAFYVIRIIGKLDVGVDVLKRLIRVFSDCYVKTGYGQLLDILYSSNIDQDVLRTNIPEEICLLKTAYYTFVYPMLFGYILSGSEKGEEKKIVSLGEKIGVAFQYRDDLYGIFGGEAKSANDISEGKYTVLVKKAAECLEPKEQAKFISILNKHDKSESDIKYVKSIIINSGSVEWLKEQITRLVKESIEELDELSIFQDSKQELENTFVEILKLPV
ncbi:MAG TPA: polyprenyl synthetase family protein [Fervidobacterium sp.]|nr:polyprenyl synthetase family protein [Fervidobacterium sp.]HQE47900.1 polyprenyl synthetase family protein [Fervidobacterium sp.]HUM42067.1 polyprenyl synthetase family protein [Fervidobacterium sp.]